MLSEEEKLSLQAEFGEGELYRRLARAELRVSNCYIIKDWRRVIDELGAGLELNEQNVTSIITDIEKIWQDEAKLLRALKPWKIDDSTQEGEEEAGGIGLQNLGRDTFARALLHVEALQPGAVRCIVQKIPEFAEASLSTGQNNDDIARLALKQLKWMDFVVDGAALCEIMLSVVSVCPPDLQRDIIETMPGTVDDANRDMAVNELLSIIQSSPSMMASVLDALAALGVAPERLEHVNQIVLNTLAAVDQDALPATLRYLLKATPSSSLESAIKALRESLALTSVGPAAGRLCLDTLRAAFRQRKELAEAAFRKLRTIIGPKDHKPADIWIILALMDCPAHRRSAEALFKKKAADESLRPWVIEAAITPFAKGLSEVSPYIIALASLVLKAPEPGARVLGVTIFKVIFKSFPDGAVRRDVVVALLEHTGSRRDLEIDSALDALVAIALATEKDRSLIPHSAALQTLLDFLELYNDSQLRKIWSIFGILCRSHSSAPKRKERIDHDNSDEDHSDLAMLDIIIRKELTHTSKVYRRIGIVGACTLIKILGTKNNNILPMLLDNVKKSPWCEALAYDELARALTQKDGHRVPESAIDTMLTTVQQDFEARFTKDLEPSSTQLSEDVPLVKPENADSNETEIWMCLDEESAELCIPIVDYVNGCYSKNPDLLQVMVPNLRLLWSLTSLKHNGDLNDIDALIGCPMKLPSRSQVESFGSLSSLEKRQTLLALFSAFNWVAELLNAFSNQANVEMYSKCLERLNNLIELREIISNCVLHFSAWKEILYDANHSTTETGLESSGNALHKKTSKKNKQGGGGASTMWLSLGRHLSLDTLSLISAATPVSAPVYDKTEADEPSAVKQVSLRPASLSFLLHQVASCVSTYLGMQGKVKSNTSSASLLQVHGLMNESSELSTTLAPLDFLLRLKPSLLALGKQLRRCLLHLQIIESTGQECVDDNPEDLESWQECMILCLKCYAGALSAPVMRQEGAARNLLFDILAATDLTDDVAAVHRSDPITDIDIGIAAKRAFEQLRRTIGASFGRSHGLTQSVQEMLEGCSVTFQAYALYLAALDGIVKFAGSTEREALYRKLSDSAGSLLERDWDRLTMKASKTISVVPVVLSMHVRAAPDPIETIEHIIEMLKIFREKKSQVESDASQGSQGRTAKNDEHRIWGTMDGNTFHLFGKTLLQECCRQFRLFDGSTFEGAANGVLFLNRLIAGTYSLFLIVRGEEKLLTVAMRNGRIIVDAFTRKIMPFLKEHFREHRDDILATLKLQQKITRLLQTFCSHGKAQRNSALTSIVPSLRKALELLLYRVKEMMQTQRAGKAFQLGNLRHRDITGAIVPSQLQYQSEASEYSDSDEDSTINDEDEIQESTPPAQKRGQSRGETEIESSRLTKKQKMKNFASASRKRKRPEAETITEVSEDKENDPSSANVSGSRWKKPKSAKSKVSKKSTLSRKKKSRYSKVSLLDTEATEVSITDDEGDSQYESDLGGFIVNNNVVEDEIENSSGDDV